MFISFRTNINLLSI